MLGKFFEKPRYVVAAVGGLIILQGVIFRIVDPSLFSTIAIVVGMVVVATGLIVEIQAAVRQISENLCAYFERVKEQRTRLAEEREREDKLEVEAAQKPATKRKAQSLSSAVNQTERLIVPSSRLSVASSEPTRAPCPYCGELIAATAIKCRYCDEFLDGRASLSAIPASARLESSRPQKMTV